MSVPGVGLFGKCPSHGDFLRRRVSDAFVNGWDAWLQESLDASRWALADRWLEVYLTSPAWRFACAAGACGAAPIAGVMVPSVDSVGRYFPLTVVAELPHGTNLIASTREAGTFFAAAERLLVDTLAAADVNFETFDEEVANLGLALADVQNQSRVVLEEGQALLADGAHAGWHIALGDTTRLAPAFEHVLWQRLSMLHNPIAIWWTEGSAIVEPSCLVSTGLPGAESFAALLDGSWQQRAWQPLTSHVEVSVGADKGLADPDTALRVRSAAASDVGLVRQCNEDACLERPEAGVWAVADGLGGHSNGDLASRMVCDALADLVPSSSAADAVEAIRQRMSDVNEHLLRRGARSGHADRCGSTVAILVVRGSRCAALWAGDSRVYRWRSGRLESLTRDHSIEPHAVTKAVGGEPELTLDVHLDRVRPGDRYLLCSDGLTRTVPETSICALLREPDVRAAADALIHASLRAGAPDNVTVVIVDAESDGP